MDKHVQSYTGVLNDVRPEKLGVVNDSTEFDMTNKAVIFL